MNARLLHVRPDYAAACWTVTHYVADPLAEGGYSEDPSILALFGSATLPTPWRLIADERAVMADLRRLNPDACVERV